MAESVDILLLVVEVLLITGCLLINRVMAILEHSYSVMTEEGFCRVRQPNGL